MTARKTTTRLIINNDSELSISDVVPYVEHVIGMGRISTGANGKKMYCYVTTFDRQRDGLQVIVFASRSTPNSDSFIVRSERVE